MQLSLSNIVQVRALSTLLSTAALDKHPQSRERGITLDLGFSAFQTELPQQFSGVCQIIFLINKFEFLFLFFLPFF